MIALHRALASARWSSAAVPRRATAWQPPDATAAADIDARRDRIRPWRWPSASRRASGCTSFDLRGRGGLRARSTFRRPRTPRSTSCARARTAAVDAHRAVCGRRRAPRPRRWMLLRLRGYRHVGVPARWRSTSGLRACTSRHWRVDATAAERAEFERLAALSRYFGGQPRLDVPRARDRRPAIGPPESTRRARPSMATSLLVAAIRRRGC